MEKSKFNFWKTIYSFIRPYKKNIIISIVCASLVGVVAALQPIVVKWLIDEGILRKNSEGLLPIDQRLKYSLIFVGVYISLSIFRMIVGVSGTRVLTYGLEKFIADIQYKVFRHVQRLCFRFHDEVSSGELYSYIMGTPVQSLRIFLRQAGVSLPLQIVSWVVAVSTLASFNLPMTVATIIMISAIVFVNFHSRKVIRDNSSKFMKTESAVSRYVADMLRGARAIKMYAIEEPTMYSFENQIDRIKSKGIKLHLSTIMEHAKAESLQYVGMSAIYLLGVYFCLYRSMEVGTLFAFIASINLLMAPLMNLMQMNMIQGNAEAGLERIIRLLEKEESTPDVSQNALITLEEAEGRARENNINCIEFNKVSFSYDFRKNIISSLSCKIPHAQSVALVGPSGSGKTTFVSLLMRLYDINEGKIMINGEDIKNYSLHDLRSSFAVVPQEPFLFQGSILDNIRITAPNASDEEVNEAMRIANIYEFIEEMPNRENTYVGEGGASLSGGQKQRISIARAILSKSKYYIFDEATSALDNKSEEHIKEAMDGIIKGHTSFIIAHRLSTIRNVDRILVFDKGVIVEDGTFDELSKQEGLFSSLLNTQRFH